MLVDELTPEARRFVERWSSPDAPWPTAEALAQELHESYFFRVVEAAEFVTLVQWYVDAVVDGLEPLLDDASIEEAAFMFGSVGGFSRFRTAFTVLSTLYQGGLLEVAVAEAGAEGARRNVARWELRLRQRPEDDSWLRRSNEARLVAVAWEELAAQLRELLRDDGSEAA